MSFSRRPKSTEKKPPPSAYNKALGLLSRREHSEKELAQRLKRAGYEKDDSETAIEKLQSINFQSDDRFAELLVRSRVGQGYGPRRIAYELANHGLSREAIALAIATEDADWLSIATQLTERKFGRKAANSHAERNKRAQFLLRRGFDVETVKSVARVEEIDGDCEVFDD